MFVYWSGFIIIYFDMNFVCNCGYDIVRNILSRFALVLALDIIELIDQKHISFDLTIVVIIVYVELIISGNEIKV